MNYNYQWIEKEIERFFEGESSNEEEQELFDFFSSENVPEHLLPYRPIFAYFKTGIAEETISQKIIPATIKSSQKRKIRVWTGIAASFLIFTLCGTYYLNRKKDLNLYEGSYIVLNGVKITNPRIVIPEIKKSLLLAQQQEAEFDRLFQHLQEIIQEDPYEQAIEEITNYKF